MPEEVLANRFYLFEVPSADLMYEVQPSRVQGHPHGNEQIDAVKGSNHLVREVWSYVKLLAARGAVVPVTASPRRCHFVSAMVVGCMPGQPRLLHMSVDVFRMMQALEHSLPGPVQKKRGRRRNVLTRDRKRLGVGT